MSERTFLDVTRVDDGPDVDVARPAAESGRFTVLPPAPAGGSPAASAEPRPRFRPVRPLGEGGLGVVVAADDLDIGRTVAIKSIRPDRRTEGVFLRFVQEVRTVGQLDHPNIVPIHDVGRDPDGTYWFVMKHVDGDTLETLLDRLRAGDRDTHARFNFERRAELFLQVLHAVAFAHARGIVHRDLKPSNVMIGRYGEVQLLDWGVARRLGQAPDAPDEGGPATGTATVTTTRAGQLVGTPLYMSPEQARGEPVDERCDTWALSMLFYELLTLRHPFEDREGVDELIEAVQHAPIPHPSTRAPEPVQGPVPVDLAWFAVDGLDRERRYRTVGEMITRLERRNDGLVPVQCPVSLQLSVLGRVRRLLNRHPAAATLLVAAALLVGATLAVAVGLVGALALAAG